MITAFAFCGLIGSGKSSLSKCFASRIGGAWNSFGNTVRAIAAERGIDANRESLQRLGAALVAEESERFCSRVVSGPIQSGRRAIVIDGLRHQTMMKCMRRLVTPGIAVCIYVDAPPEIRLKRLKERDELSEDQIKQLQAHSTEIEVEHELRALSDFVVMNGDCLDKSTAQLLSWVQARRLLD